MNVKQVSGILAVIVGVALIGFSVYAKNKILHAKEGIDQISGFFPKSEAGSAVEHSVHSKIGRYEILVRWSMIGGVVLAAAGAYFVVRFRKG